MSIYARFDSFVGTSNKVFDVIKSSDVALPSSCEITIVNLGLKKTFEKIKLLKKSDNQFVISCFSGALFGDHKTLLSRVNADMVLLNSPYDFEEYLKLGRELKFSTDNAYCFGYPQLLNAETKSAEPSHICFFEQIKFPSESYERVRLVRELIDLAQEFPSESFLIKPRCKPGERTIHKQFFHIEDILTKEKLTLPKNLRITYLNTESILSDCKMSITISSTVAIESIALQIPTVILTDFGVCNENYSSGFVGSGCLFSFSELKSMELEVPVPNKQWVSQHVKIPDENAFLIELASRMRNQRSESSRKEIYYGASKAPRPSSRYSKVIKLFEDPYLFFHDSKITPLKKIGTFFFKDKYSR